jgi:hypothetical protein
MTTAVFDKLFKNSAVKRTKFDCLKETLNFYLKGS